MIHNAGIDSMLTVLLAGFAAHFKVTIRQIIYKNHLLQE